MQNRTQELRNLRKTIGYHIHRRRMEKKMTLRKLSRLTGININKLDQYEMGKNEIRLEDIFLLAERFNIGLETLLKN